LAIDIDADHPRAGGFEQLDRDLSDHTKPDDDEAFAQRRLQPTHALQRDGPHRDGRGVAIGNGLRYGHDEIARNADVLGVVSALRARAGDAVADRNIRCTVADGDGPPD